MVRFGVVAALFMLASCAQTEIAGTHVTGMFTAVREQDVRAAMAAAESAEPRWHGRIREVQVISSTKMHIYRDPKTLRGWQVVRKIGGKWNATELAISAE